MTITITWQLILGLIGLVTAWSGFLLGGIKWLLNRQVVALENRLAAAEKEASDAKSDVSKHKAETTAAFSAINSELNNLPVSCCSHKDMVLRMDGHNNRLEQHKQLVDQIAGDVKHLPKTGDLERIHHRVDQVFRLADAIKGELKGITNNISLLLEHHIKER